MTTDMELYEQTNCTFKRLSRCRPECVCRTSDTDVFSNCLRTIHLVPNEYIRALNTRTIARLDLYAGSHRSVEGPREKNAYAGMTNANLNALHETDLPARPRVQL